ncbi:nitroreductase family protein [Mycolicibacterium sp.]|uniref:nitroreductase family protein n=1 Tax=Mycolicibacterium sp. TaxID=2320850 RepID=UPI001A35E9AF|nr:nitroreductase family protein [Mycolicibacterium sp.]MBJ7337723.1 nitroreductase family protein [Mycolicibacterium sp.]
MELYDVMRTTGAVRHFTGDPLPDDVLERILDNARFAPTGGNRQGVRVIVVRDMPTRERLAELSKPGAQRYAAQLANGESPWNPLQPCGVDPQTVASTEPPEQMTAPLREAAVLLVICLDLGVVAATDQDLDRVGVISGASVYPFVWNVLLAARNEGYGGVLTTMTIAEEPRVRALLGVPDHYAIATVVPLGKPAHQVRKLTRKPVAEFVTRERFDGAAL